MIARVSSDTDPRNAPGFEPDLGAVEERIGHAFDDRALLLTALTHRSWAHEAGEEAQDNESLEFLGDAILAFLVADLLYRSFPGLDEGRLSKHKAVLEKSATLAEVARELGLGAFLRLGRGERLGGGARNDKILANAFEAVLAAVYLDGGLDAARRFVGLALGPRVGELDAENPINDYKSVLQETAQGLGLGTPRYEVVGESGPDHDKRFRVQALVGDRALGEGEGFTKRGAQQVAARCALRRLLSSEQAAD
jgi:ribonuclease-3